MVATDSRSPQQSTQVHYVEIAAPDSSLLSLRPIEAVFRNLALTLLTFIVVAALAFVGLSGYRQTYYTAEARIVVGSFDVNYTALPGQITATSALASVYSRYVNSSDSRERIGSSLQIDKTEVAARLNASPIPESPIIRIRATGPTEESALRLTKAGTDELQRFIATFSQGSTELPAIQAEAGKVQQQIGAYEAQMTTLRASIDLLTRRVQGVLPPPLTQTEADPLIAAAEAKIGELSGKIAELNLQNRSIDRKFEDALGSAASQNRAFELTEPTSLGSNASKAKRLAAGMAIVVAAIAATVVATGWAEFRLRRKWRNAPQVEPERTDEPDDASPGIDLPRGVFHAEPDTSPNVPDWLMNDTDIDDIEDNDLEPAATSQWISPAERYRMRRAAAKSRYGGG